MKVFCAVCGNEFVTYPSGIKRGQGKYCGNKCKGIARKGILPGNASHLMSRTSTYDIWFAMRSRCNNPRDKDYPNYGARGISVSAEWADFSAFHKDMGDRPKGMTLGRINNNAGYSAANCRWETQKQQQNNRRSNVILEFNGRRQTVTQWAEEYGMLPATLRYRLASGWPTSKALNAPLRADHRRAA